MIRKAPHAKPGNGRQPPNGTRPRVIVDNAGGQHKRSLGLGPANDNVPAESRLALHYLRAALGPLLIAGLIVGIILT